jgi:octopine/nopaline transport system substrate-binding protein
MIVLPVLAAGLALAQVVHAKDWSKITIATTAAFMPYNGADASGNPIGYEIDLAKNLCVRMKMNCIIISTSDWSGLIPNLMVGKYDVVMAALNITPKRLKLINFSDPYAMAPSAFAVRTNSPLASMPVRQISLDDKTAVEVMIRELTPYLKDKRIGVQISTNQVDLLDTYFRGIIGQMHHFTSAPKSLRALQAGRVDAVLQLTTYIADVIPKYDDQFVLAGPLMSGGVLGPGAGVGLRKEDNDLKDLFNNAIDQAKADGTLRRLTLKWFNSDISPQN